MRWKHALQQDICKKYIPFMKILIQNFEDATGKMSSSINTEMLHWADIKLFGLMSSCRLPPSGLPMVDL